ncbi:MAG: hypothetical protein HQM10_19615 [Candidatus Riflebacteria bacterium]|nr:hypothetical protein [Candidatus Riflebacteria bacterium]
MKKIMQVLFVTIILSAIVSATYAIEDALVLIKSAQSEIAYAEMTIENQGDDFLNRAIQSIEKTTSAIKAIAQNQNLSSIANECLSCLEKAKISLIHHDYKTAIALIRTIKTEDLKKLNEKIAAGSIKPNTVWPFRVYVQGVWTRHADLEAKKAAAMLELGNQKIEGIRMVSKLTAEVLYSCRYPINEAVLKEGKSFVLSIGIFEGEPFEKISAQIQNLKNNGSIILWVKATGHNSNGRILTTVIQHISKAKYNEIMGGNLK